MPRHHHNYCRKRTTAAARLAGERLERRDCPAPLLSITLNDAIVLEGEPVVCTLRLSEPSTAAERVFVTTTDGTATYGTDYFAPVSQQVVFAPGQIVRTVSISTLRDAGRPLAEGNETFRVTATPTTTSLSTRSAIATIADYIPPPVISVQDIAVVEGNSGTTFATFTLDLSSRHPRAVTVNYATRDLTATAAGQDYVAATGSLTFAAGETSKTITVTVNGDRVLESNETFSLVLSSPVNAVIGRATGVCTIHNDETDQSGFQITVNYLTPMQPAWTQAVSRAVAKWQSIIVGDVPGVEYQGRFIDDFEISVSFQSLAPSVLGYARYLEQRPGIGGLPYLGEMVMNTAYANLPGIYDTVVHELAHALGFAPPLWTQLGLIGGTVADPRFLGANATREFNSIFSSAATGVPLYEQGTPGDGSYGSHWRDSVFGNESMVSASDPAVTNIPVSRITVGHFADIGYFVNYAAADTFTPPSARGFTETQPRQRAIARAWAAVNRPLIHTHTIK